MDKYEYTVYECVWEIGRKDQETKHVQKLNDLGAQGWQLKGSVGPLGTGAHCRYTFERLVGSGPHGASTLTESK